MATARRSSARQDALYDFVKVLGRGSMAMVELWRQNYINHHEFRVAKRIYLGELTPDEENEARQEAHLLKGLTHPHIVKYYNSWMNKDDNELVIIQDYYEGGDLAQLIARAREHASSRPSNVSRRRTGIRTEPFTDERRWQWLHQLVHALQYCHQRLRILHRDLKPGNIFLSAKFESVHIGDFGVAKVLDATCGLAETFIGTQVYMSPEVLRMQSYGTKSDVWGLGVILFEMCTLRRLFDTKDAVQMVLQIASPDESPKVPEGDSDADMQALCAMMLRKNPDERPTLGQLLCSHSPLRDGVLQLERDIGWEASLVPKNEEDEDLLVSAKPPTIATDSKRDPDVQDAEACEDQRHVSGEGTRAGESSSVAAHGQVEEPTQASQNESGSGEEPFQVHKRHVADNCSRLGGDVKHNVPESNGRRYQPPETRPLQTREGDNGPTQAENTSLRSTATATNGGGVLTAFVAERAKALTQLSSSLKSCGNREKIDVSVSPYRPERPQQSQIEDTENLPSGSRRWYFARSKQKTDETAVAGDVDQTNVASGSGDPANLLNDTAAASVTIAENPVRSAIKSIESIVQETETGEGSGSVAVAAAIEAAIHEASQVKDVLEVSMRKNELGEVLAWASATQPRDPDAQDYHPAPRNIAKPSAPSSHEMALFAAGFRSERNQATSSPAEAAVPSQPRANGLPSLLPHVPDTVPTHADVPARGSGGDVGNAVEVGMPLEAARPPPEAMLSQAVQEKAAVVDARLRCVEMLRTQAPDPIEFSVTLQTATELKMGNEPCGQAVLAKAHRLSLHATDVVADDSASAATIERAAEMLTAVQHDVGTASQVLEDANTRLASAVEAESRVAIRCQCGPLVRFLSVRRDAPFSQAVAQVARRWDRAPETVNLTWREGSALYSLRTEEQWQQCLRVHPQGPVELVLQAAQPLRPPAKKTLAGLAASSKPVPKAKVKFNRTTSQQTLGAGLSSIRAGV